MRKLHSSKGFTIIELLIATAVFSVILLILTAAIVQIGRIYHKGTITSRTQETARNVINSISQDIQFGSGNVPHIASSPSDHVFGFAPVGNICYQYQRGNRVNSSQHALLAIDGPCNSPGGFPPNGGNELLGNNMQLVDLSVQRVGSTNLYEVKVHVVYGQDSDFTDVSKTSCRTLSVGGQFCAVAQLSTTVAKRIN